MPGLHFSLSLLFAAVRLGKFRKPGVGWRVTLLS